MARLALGLELVTLCLLCTLALPKELPKSTGYHILNVTAWKSDSYDEPKKSIGSSLNDERGTWTLRIFHRDEPSSPFRRPGANRQELLLEMLKRDEARVKGINTRLALALEEVQSRGLKPGAYKGQMAIPENFSSPVVSGTAEGSGEFFTRISIGIPPRDSYLIMDTGSDLSWVQCLPCVSCYEQSDPIFDPAFSLSYRPVTCPSPMCSDVDATICTNQYCYYEVSYADGSFSSGNLGVETFSFGSREIQSVVMGCGHDNEGLFVGAAGLLGLGAGAMSFASQIAAETNGIFSYCLSERVTSGPSSLVFGEGAVPEGASFTSLLKNPKIDTFYYVALTGISIDNSLVSFSASDISLKSTGAGGVIIDSGTTVTRLVYSVYNAMRDAFRVAAQVRNLRYAESYSVFDTCYDFSGVQFVPLPLVELHFEGGVTLSLPPMNYLMPIDEDLSTVCFSFAGTSGDLSIIGNMQQQGFRISFDTIAARVGFQGNQCNG